MIFKWNSMTFHDFHNSSLEFNDVHEFQFENQTWTRRIALDNFEPSTRTFHQSTIINNYLYIFGGFDGNKTNDVYRA